jgi:integrase
MRAEAKAFASQIEADKSRGLYSDPHLGKITFAEWADHWLSTKVRLKPKTIDGYHSVLRTHLLPEFGRIPIARIDPIHVQQWVADMDAAGLSTSRIRQAYQLLSASLKAAVESGYLGRTPCVGVRVPRTAVREKRYLTEHQVALLAESIREPYGALVYVLAYGGLRWAEAVGLRKSRCDLLRSRLEVTETLSEVGGRFHWVPPKTYEKRSVAIPAFVRDMLDDLVSATDSGAQRLVFTSSEGAPLRSSNFAKRVWTPALDRLIDDIPRDLTPHHLRHTCASLMIRAGAHARAVQGHLGHSSITVTMDVYGHLFPDDMDALAGRLDAAHRTAAAPPNVRSLRRDR